MFKLDDKTENTQSILTRARDLVAVGWCQYAHAKTEEGHVVEALHRDACAYCTTGAVIRAMYERNPDMDEEDEDEERHCAVAALLTFTDCGTNNPPDINEASLAGWNDRDTMTQPQVLTIFTRAIEATAD